MKVGYNNAERLVRTELNFVQNKAAIDSIQTAGLEHYQFIAALDHRTCPRCGGIDGRICRCTIAATLGEGVSRRGKRAARDADGKRIKLDVNVTYEKWKARYIDKNANVTPAGNLPFKRQTHFSTSDENIVATNPNYNLSRAYQQNCQRCVPTYEMRMRGYDVVAKPVYDLATDDFANSHWSDVFKNAIIEENLPGTGKEYIINQMLNWDDGARAEVYVEYINGADRYAHVFVAENRNGIVYFLDPQTGELDVEYYFDEVEKGLTKFFRIDDLEINEKYIAECCEEIKK